MFDLEKAIAEWKRAMRRSPSIDEGDLAELELYLRDKVDDLAAGGLGLEEAFRRAEAEFRRACTLDAAYGQARSSRPGRRFPWTKARFAPGLLWSNVRIALRRLHDAERRMSEMFSVFAVLAIAVACLGLFGLAAYTAERRTKEIGVRKVLGASSWNVYASLAREFLRWVVLANLVAWPLAYYAMSRWLRSFASRVEIGWAVFPAAAAAALLIAALTVGSQTWRAARANPVDSLRYE